MEHPQGADRSFDLLLTPGIRCTRGQAVGQSSDGINLEALQRVFPKVLIEPVIPQLVLITSHQCNSGFVMWFHSGCDQPFKEWIWLFRFKMEINNEVIASLKIRISRAETRVGYLNSTVHAAGSGIKVTIRIKFCLLWQCQLIPNTKTIKFS